MNNKNIYLKQLLKTFQSGNILSLLAIVLFTSLVSCSIRYDDDFVGQKGLYSLESASRWQHSLISGNGVMGIMVAGKPADEQVIFNYESLYEPIGSENVEPPDIAKYLPETRHLLKEGKYEEAIRYSYKMARTEDYPGLLWTDPYHPALEMEIRQDTGKAVSAYKRSINFDTGEIKVEWSADGIKQVRKSFVSRADNVIVQKIEGGNRDVNCSITLKMQGATPRDFAEHRRMPVGYEEPYKTTGSEWLTFRVKYKLNDRGYEVVTRLLAPGGESLVSGDTLSVKGADEVLMISRIVPLEHFDRSEIEDTKTVLANINPNYSELLKRHTAIHQEIFDRVSFDIYPDNLPRHSTEEMIEAQKEHPDSISAELLETLFYMGRYTLLSSSGNNPPNLMGIWNGQWRPAWSGDFTTDANINLQISSANICNMPEAIDSYMKMLERIAPDWEINARKLYGCRGYLAGTRTSGRRGLHTHFNVSFPGHFWLAGAEWLLLPAYDYYLVSGDTAFLKSRLLLMMEKTALFFEDFLTERDENDHLWFAPSYSPENTPSNIKVQATVNATMDIAAAKEAFTHLVSVYKQLGIKHEKVAQYENMLKQFPPYLINEDGALKEWAAPDLQDNYNHRHVSHLYPVWPGLEINPEETPELFKAATIAAEKRGAGNASAHGLTHMALIGARLKNPSLVSKNLRFLLTNDFLFNGLFTSHNPHLRIFNSDALNSFSAVISEALIYSRPGFIELLPAWDKTLPAGTITNQLCRTQAKVEKLTWNLKKGLIECTISSLKKQDVDIVLRHFDGEWMIHGVSDPVNIKKGEPLKMHFNKGEKKVFRIRLTNVE